MIKKLIIFLFIFSFAFEVEFSNSYQTFITPNKRAIFINKIFPINYKNIIYTQKGMILLNYNQADEFVRNDLYMPNNSYAKNINIAIIDIDKIRIQLIHKIQTQYRCKIKKIEFLNTPKKIYFKPTLIKIKYKTTLECKG